MAKNTRTVLQTAIGIDVSDKASEVCHMGADGEVADRARIATTKSAFEKYFRRCERTRVALEAGTHTRWAERLLVKLGYEVYVANPRKVALIAQNDNKTDKADAELLARLVRADPKLLSPVQPHSPDLDSARALLRTRDLVVASRAQWVNHVRGAVKTAGGRVKPCSTEAFAKEAREQIPPELRMSLLPLLDQIEALTAQIRRFDKDIERVGVRAFPVTQQLQSIGGIGPVTSLAFVTSVGDPKRFTKSRTVGAYFGLRPRRDESGDFAPELRITKAGDGFVRKLLVQAAHCVLARGPDSSLKRWGLKLAGRGRKNAKKRAIVAVARKLAVIMHSMWVSGAVYEPFPVGRKD